MGPPTRTSPGRSLVEDAQKVIESRRRRYGDDAAEFFARVADLWQTYLGFHVGTLDVINLMILLKVVRHELALEPTDDDLIDIIGYVALMKDIEVQSAEG